ncbi:RluA family pseudouridine synthase [Sinanaerobacter chloroacetimidivorans]|uniref:Pseudouridine synthase n=1 Tax=Sinanaerobacter chloroacetimidivorans TaxID=2818044 RepID=A0A8J7VZD0_9FIRM|nr:RluA family pseudouridine synthase [Sinanaerobacter chloroacetimidivorans]MBR0596788.1 RluA family pseudouridine synthase [Sinanaerobacter chloroacetimidivorans]
MDNLNLFEVKIEEDLQGTRLDVVLSLVLEEASRSYLQKLIEAGKVQINGVPCASKKWKVKKGDEILLEIPEPEALDVMPEDIPLTIVYEDEDLLVVNKPKGMVVHPGAGNTSGTLVNAILFHCDHLSSINGVIRPGIVHRIDKDTSGLLMVAKNDIAHRSLAEQLANHSITRAYRAIVYHNFTEDEGTVNAPIGRDPKNRLKMAVTKQNGREAVTHYKVLERFGNFTYVEARLETGRTHQIRVHMAYIKHPLLGDAVYGPHKQVLGAETQMLHAKVLGFKHPRTNEYMEFDSDLPEEFQKILNKLGGTYHE